MSHAFARWRFRPKPVRGADASGLATSWLGPVYRKYAACGRSTRTRRSPGFRPARERRPPIIGRPRALVAVASVHGLDHEIDAVVRGGRAHLDPDAGLQGRPARA